MTSKPNGVDENKQLEAAWNKLASRLEKEEMSPKWSSWSMERGIEPKAAHSFEEDALYGVLNNEIRGERIDMTNHQNQEQKTSVVKKKHTMKKPVKKWLSIATAAAVAGVMIATPLGDKALAAILNQFRMDEVTVVNEGDVMQFFNTVSEGSSSSDFINKHGSFTNAYGPELNNENLSLKEIEEITGLTAYQNDIFNEEGYYAFSSQTITMKLNIHEVNSTMARLGAKELMPESLDGKPITLHIPETLHQYYHADADGENLYASLSQQKLPTVEVDPSVPVEEAVQAVLDFPLLPDKLKTAIKSDNILSGKLPMPVFTDGDAEKVEVKEVPVVIVEQDYVSSTGKPVYTAAWTQDGVLFNLSGDSLFDSKEKLLAEVEEMITE